MRREETQTDGERERERERKKERKRVRGKSGAENGGSGKRGIKARPAQNAGEIRL